MTPALDRATLLAVAEMCERKADDWTQLRDTLQFGTPEWQFEAGLRDGARILAGAIRAMAEKAQP